MNIVSKAVRSTKFQALATLLLLCLLPHFFIRIKKMVAPVTSDKKVAKSSFFSTDSAYLPWQKRLLNWAKFANPMIFTAEAGNMSFVPNVQKTRFQPNPLPPAKVDLKQIAINGNNSLPITFLPTPSFASLLQQTFKGFSVSPTLIQEPVPQIPTKPFFRATDGRIIDLIDDFDVSTLKEITTPTSSTAIEISDFGATFPRVILKKSCGNVQLDIMATQKLSSFLLSADNKDQWLDFFNNAASMTVEMEWRLRSKND